MSLEKNVKPTAYKELSKKSSKDRFVFPKIKKYQTSLLLASLIFSLSVAAKPSKVSLNFDTKYSGIIYLSVFNKSEGFPNEHQKASKRMRVVKYNRGFVMKNVGRPFAIAAFQDENKNKKLDRNSLGIPLEPVAFTGDPAMNFSAPEFDESVVKDPKISKLTLKFHKL